MANDLGSLGQANVEVRANLSRLETDFKSAEQLARRVTRRIERSFQRLGVTFDRIGTTLTTRVTLPLLALGGAAAKTAKTFERTLSQVEGLVGESREAVQKFRQDILDLAPAVGQFPNELAKGLFFITSAGIKGGEALDTLEASAKAASAGLGSVETVADAVTSALNAYAQSGLTAEQATDVLVQTVTEGKAAADSIAGALGEVLPTSSKLKVSFDQVGASIAAMTKVGIPATVAVTSLNATLNAILNPGADAREALDEIGVSAEELRRVLAEHGLLPTLEFLQQAFRGNDEAIVRVFPNVRALRAVFTLLGENSEEVRRIFDSLANSTGALDRSFGAYARTADSQLDKALIRLNSTMIRLGERVLPIVTPAINEFADVVGTAFDKFAGADTETKGAIAALTATGVAAGPAAFLLARLSKAFALLAAALRLLSVPLKTTTFLFLALAAAILTILPDLETLTGKWQEFWDILGRLGKSSSGAATEVFRVLGIELRQRFPEAMALAEQAIADNADAVDEAADAVKAGGETVAAAASDAVQAIQKLKPDRSLFQDTIDLMAGLAEQIQGFADPRIEDAFRRIGALFEQNVSGPAEEASAAINEIGVSARSLKSGKPLEIEIRPTFSKELAESARDLREQVRPLEELKRKIEELNTLAAKFPKILTPDVVSDLATKWRADLDPAIERTRELVDDLGGAFASAFEDAILGAESFMDILRALEADILRILARKLISEPLGDAITDILGGVFGGATSTGGSSAIVTDTVGSIGASSGGGGGGFFSSLGSIFGSLFGAQHGLDATVPLTPGGPDTTIAALRVTGGERIRVDDGGPTGQQINLTVNMNAPVENQRVAREAGWQIAQGAADSLSVLLGRV